MERLSRKVQPFLAYITQSAYFCTYLPRPTFSLCGKATTRFFKQKTYNSK